MNFQPSLNWRIALTNAALIFLALAVPTFFLTGMLRDRFATAWEQRLEQQAQLVGATFSPYLEPTALTLTAKTANLQDLSRELERVVNAHITIISIDGAVLADSRQSPESPPGNYSILPEVRQALAGDLGRSSRNDPAGSEAMFYTAVPIWNNGAVVGAVRLGAPASQAEYNLGPVYIPLALWALAAWLSFNGAGILDRPSHLPGGSPGNRRFPKAGRRRTGLPGSVLRSRRNP